MILFKIKKIEKNLLTVQIFYNLQNNPTFHPEERSVILRKKKRVLCWSIYIISLWIAPLVDILTHPKSSSSKLFECWFVWFHNGDRSYLKWKRSRSESLKLFSEKARTDARTASCKLAHLVEVMSRHI